MPIEAYIVNWWKDAGSFDVESGYSLHLRSEDIPWFIRNEMKHPRGGGKQFPLGYPDQVSAERICITDRDRHLMKALRQAPSIRVLDGRDGGIDPLYAETKRLRASIRIPASEILATRANEAREPLARRVASGLARRLRFCS